jgi:hypothetical protein
VPAKDADSVRKCITVDKQKGCIGMLASASSTPVSRRADGWAGRPVMPSSVTCGTGCDVGSTLGHAMSVAFCDSSRGHPGIGMHPGVRIGAGAALTGTRRWFEPASRARYPPKHSVEGMQPMC